MRVAVYIDAYNLYYSARTQCGRGTAGWRWLDLRALATTLVTQRRDWAGAQIERIMYCTARIDAATNPGGHRDQDIYLKALRATGSVDHIEYGRYVARLKYAPLAVRDQRGRPQLVRPDWPVMIQDAHGQPIQDGTFLVSVLNREEKGSDVNLAAHLLADVLQERVAAAVVISNDSDLELPLRMARAKVPVGLVNPSKGRLAGALAATAAEGAGRHWWRQLTPADYFDHQLPDAVGNYLRPAGW